MKEMVRGYFPIDSIWGVSPEGLLVEGLSQPQCIY